MKNVPKDWRIELLDNVARRGSGHTPDRKIKNYWDGGIKWVSLADSDKLDRVMISATEHEISEAGIANSSAVKHSVGSVLVSRDAGVGKSAVMAEEMAVSQHFIAWKCGPELHNFYLYYWLQKEKKHFERMAVGSTIKTIGLSFFEKFEIAFPPIAQQKAIAAILLLWDDMIQKKVALVTLQVERKRGLMQQLLTGISRFKNFKGERRRKKILADVVTYEPRITTKPKGVFLAAGIRSYGKGVFLKPDFDAEDIALDDLFLLRTDDLVVNITFGWEGAAAIVPPLADGALVSHRFPTFIFKQGVSFPGYFRHVIRQKRFVHEMGLASPGGAGRNRVLSKSDFLNIPVELPSFEEQQQIAAVLNTCDHEIELLQKQLEALKEQKRGLMQKLLTGEITVKY